jgi:tetratricopeptide (TPR) repeat protein
MPDEEGVKPALLERLEKVTAPSEPLPLANVCRVLASGWDDAGKPERSVPYWRRTLDLRQRHLGEDKPATVDAAIGLASALVALDRATEAEHAILRARYCAGLALAQQDPATLRADLCLVNVWEQLGRADEADRLFEAVILAFDRVRKAHDGDTIATIEERASRLFETRPSAAAYLFRKVVNRLSQQPGGVAKVERAKAEYNLGTALYAAKDYEASAKALREATAIFDELDPDDEDALTAKCSLAAALLQSNRPDEAKGAANEVLQRMRLPSQAGHRNRLMALHTLGRCGLLRLADKSSHVKVEDVCDLYDQLLKSNEGVHRDKDPVVADDVINLTSHIDHRAADKLLGDALQRYRDRIDPDTTIRLEQRRSELQGLSDPQQ